MCFPKNYEYIFEINSLEVYNLLNPHQFNGKPSIKFANRGVATITHIFNICAISKTKLVLGVYCTQCDPDFQWRHSSGNGDVIEKFRQGTSYPFLYTVVPSFHLSFGLGFKSWGVENCGLDAGCWMLDGGWDSMQLIVLFAVSGSLTPFNDTRGHCFICVYAFCFVLFCSLLSINLSSCFVIL